MLGFTSFSPTYALTSPKPDAATLPREHMVTIATKAPIVIIDQAS